MPIATQTKRVRNFACSCRSTFHQGLNANCSPPPPSPKVLILQGKGIVLQRLTQPQKSTNLNSTSTSGTSSKHSLYPNQSPLARPKLPPQSITYMQSWGSSTGAKYLSNLPIQVSTLTRSACVEAKCVLKILRLVQVI